MSWVRRNGPSTPLYALTLGTRGTSCPYSRAELGQRPSERGRLHPERWSWSCPRARRYSRPMRRQTVPSSSCWPSIPHGERERSAPSKKYDRHRTLRWQGNQEELCRSFPLPFKLGDSLEAKYTKENSTYFFFAFFNIFAKYCPVKDASTSATSSGVPFAITLPPPTPPSGPKSIR